MGSITLLDADITSPSIPKSFGLTQRAEGCEAGLFPARTKTGIEVMSLNLLLDNDTDPVVWRGPIIAGTVKQVLDHFTNPRNVGALEYPDAIGTVGDPVCGDFLELHLEVRNNNITDVRFKVRGCVAAIATSSMTTVLIKGKTLEEASLVTDRTISEALGGLPEHKMHCSILGATAVRNAIADYRLKCERGQDMKTEAAKKTCLQPVPKVLVSCRHREGRDNALAVAYCCNCSYDPPMVMVGIVPSRFSHHMVKETGCFVVNLVPGDFAETFLELGKRSGRDEDKLENLHVKTENGLKVNAPLLTDCPVNIECTVVDSILTGSHEMFVGRWSTCTRTHC